MSKAYSRLGLPEEDTDFTPVEEDEILRLVGHVGAKATPHDTVPCRVVHCVKLCLKDMSNIIQDALLFEGIVGTVYCVLLHLFRHIGKLDDSILSVSLIAGNYSCLGLYLYHYSNY